MINKKNKSERLRNCLVRRPTCASFSKNGGYRFLLDFWKVSRYDPIGKRASESSLCSEWRQTEEPYRWRDRLDLSWIDTKHKPATNFTLSVANGRYGVTYFANFLWNFPISTNPQWFFLSCYPHRKHLQHLTWPRFCIVSLFSLHHPLFHCRSQSPHNIPFS